MLLEFSITRLVMRNIKHDLSKQSFCALNNLTCIVYPSPTAHPTIHSKLFNKGILKLRSLFFKYTSRALMTVTMATNSGITRDVNSVSKLVTTWKKLDVLDQRLDSRQLVKIIGLVIQLLASFGFGIRGTWKVTVHFVVELIEKNTERVGREAYLKSYPSFADMDFWRLGITGHSLSKIRSWKIFERVVMKMLWWSIDAWSFS